MKKLITATAFIMFGTMFITAQTTQKSDKKVRMAEKPASSTEMKLETQVQPNGMNRTADTATMNNRSKMQTNPNRLQQNQTTPNNGTLQNPSTTLPNNGTLQNPNTALQNNGTLQNPNTTNPNNSTIPQQPLGPNSPTNPNPTR